MRSGTACSEEGARPARCGKTRFVWIRAYSTPVVEVCTPELGTVPLRSHRGGKQSQAWMWMSMWATGKPSTGTRVVALPLAWVSGSIRSDPTAFSWQDTSREGRGGTRHAFFSSPPSREETPRPRSRGWVCKWLRGRSTWASTTKAGGSAASALGRGGAVTYVNVSSGRRHHQDRLPNGRWGREKSWTIFSGRVPSRSVRVVLRNCGYIDPKIWKTRSVRGAYGGLGQGASKQGGGEGGPEEDHCRRYKTGERLARGGREEQGFPTGG